MAPYQYILPILGREIFIRCFRCSTISDCLEFLSGEAYQQRHQMHSAALET